MADPVISFSQDGYLPHGVVPLTFNEIAGEEFIAQNFDITTSTSEIEKTNRIGNYAGMTMTLGATSATSTIELKSVSQTKPREGCTCVHSDNGVAYGWVVTSTSKPKTKGDMAVMTLNLKQLVNPLFIVPNGNYAYSSGAAISALTFSVNARHTIPTSGFALETVAIDNFRPLDPNETPGNSCDTALPTGLSLSTAGVLTGTPTATGTKRCRFRATDAEGRVGYIDIKFTVS